jgi:hypothetical protein
MKSLRPGRFQDEAAKSLVTSARAQLPVISSTNSISGDHPGLACPPTFVEFIPTPTAFEANN